MTNRVLAVAAALLVMALGSPAEAATQPRVAYTNGCCIGAGVLTVAEPDGRHRVVARTAQPITGDPSWSPDGRRIAYSTYENRVGYLRAVRTDGSGEDTLLTLPGFVIWDVSWSPDGTRIALGTYSATTFLWGVPSSVPQIFLVGADGSVVLPLGPGHQPAWSPDGSRLTFVGPEQGIYVADLTPGGTPPIRLVSSPGVLGYGPSWAPTGDRVAFLGLETTSVLDWRGSLWVANADGSGARKLPVSSWSPPAWSPGGGWLAYTSDGALYQATADGTQRRKITDGPWGAPLWSRTGWIAYRTSDPGCCQDHLWLIRPDGSGRRHVAATFGAAGVALLP